MARTRTYIAGDFDNDIVAINKLYEWKENNYLNFDFTDAHDLTQARDTSLNCNIKKSLKSRLDESKTFVLIVGEKTKSLTAGGCQYCQSYNSYTFSCARGYAVDYDSYVNYECKQAVEAGMKIVVLYNFYYPNREKCPDTLKYKGEHIAMRDISESGWNYSAIKKAIDDTANSGAYFHL